MGVSRCPRNYQLGARERGGRDWLCLWGGGVVAVYVSLSEGDAPLSPELTIGANGDAVDWTLIPPLE